MPGHIPVLLSAVLGTFQLESSTRVIDATLGGGGHAIAMLDRMSPTGRLLGIEADPRTLESTKARFGSMTQRATLVSGNFRNLKDIATQQNFLDADAVLLDLGVSSMTFEDPERGFSFRFDGPLDMRFDPIHDDITAADLVNGWGEKALADCFYGLGEERMSRQIAAAIVARRKHQEFSRTVDLADVISSVKHPHGKIHPATQVFQALRLAVNDELGALTAVLPQIPEVLKEGGRVGIITFHSLEDRIVKRWMQQAVKVGIIELLEKKPLQPDEEETKINPRSRSAKLRLFTKTKTK